MTQWVVVGRITGVYGLRGWVKVLSYTEPQENILNYAPWYIAPAAPERAERAWHPLPDLQTRRHGKYILACLGEGDRDQAARWVGMDIAVRREQLPALAPDEYYWSDLLGLRVVTLQGAELGVLTQFMETGANDVMRVSGAREHLIPYVRGKVVRGIDLTGKVMRVDWDPEF